MIKQIGRGLCFLGLVILFGLYAMAFGVQMIIWTELAGYIWFKIIAFVVWLVPLVLILGKV